QSALVADPPAAFVAEKPLVPETDGPKAGAQDPNQLPAGALARMGSAQFRHGDAILFMAYLPDGKNLLTASKDQTIRLWDVATGKEQRRFERTADSDRKGAGEDDDALEKEIGKAVENQGVARGFAGLLREMKRSFQVALSRDGRQLAASRGSLVFVW